MSDYVTPPLPTAALAQSAEQFSVSNSRINSDPVFNAQLRALLKHFDGIPEDRLRSYAGAVQRDAQNGELNETAMQCFRSAMPPGAQEPEGLAEAVEGVVSTSRRAATDSAFKAQWAAYITACRLRKERQAAARRVYEAECAQAKARYDIVMGEPAPEAPTREA